MTSVVLCDEIPVRFAVTTPALVVHEVVNVTGSGSGAGGSGSGAVPSVPDSYFINKLP